MKNKLSILLALCIFISFQAEGQGVLFFPGTWKQAIAKAKTENKPLFVDFYTDWCGPCKKMDKEVFTDAKVAEFYNTNFITIQN